MASGRRLAAVVLCVLGVGGTLVTAPARADLSSAEIVHLLNLQREANGIPAGLLERGDWSAACDKHNYYEAQSGEFGHEEDPSSPYYSAEGDWAGRSSVIAYGASWSAGNPWEDAPIHLLQMLAPQMSETGAAESYGHNCLTTWPGFKRPSPTTPTAYSYPGDGASGVVPTEHAAESPFVPGDFVGLPEGTATGRYLLAYLSGPLSFSESSEIAASATLTGPDGPVELRTIDSTSPDIGSYMPRPSAFLIPVQPLKPLTTYGAAVTWTLEGAPLLQQSFSFTTGTDPGQGAAPVRKGRSPCKRYNRAARSLRRRASKLRARARSLRRANPRARLERENRLRARAAQLKRKAARRSKQAKRCRARLGSS